MPHSNQHHSHLKNSEHLLQKDNERVEYELNIVLKRKLENQLQKIVNSNTSGREYIENIQKGKSDPYTIADTILDEMFKRPFENT